MILGSTQREGSNILPLVHHIILSKKKTNGYGDTLSILKWTYQNEIKCNTSKYKNLSYSKKYNDSNDAVKHNILHLWLNPWEISFLLFGVNPGRV